MSNADNIGPAARTRNSAGTTSRRRPPFEVIEGEGKTTWQLEAEAAAGIAAEMTRIVSRLPTDSELRGQWLRDAELLQSFAALRGVREPARLTLIEA